MTTANVMVEVLEIIILSPIFITFITIFYRAVTSILEFNRVASGMFSVVLSVLIVVGMKKHMMGTVLVPCAVLGTIFFLAPIALFIADRRKNKTKKNKKQWSRYTTKNYWQSKLKMALRKTLKSIWDVFTL